MYYPVLRGIAIFLVYFSQNEAGREASQGRVARSAGGVGPNVVRRLCLVSGLDVDHLHFSDGVVDVESDGMAPH